MQPGFSAASRSSTAARKVVQWAAKEALRPGLRVVPAGKASSRTRRKALLGSSPAALDPSTPRARDLLAPAAPEVREHVPASARGLDLARRVPADLALQEPALLRPEKVRLALLAPADRREAAAVSSIPRPKKAR